MMSYTTRWQCTLVAGDIRKQCETLFRVSATGFARSLLSKGFGLEGEQKIDLGTGRRRCWHKATTAAFDLMNGVGHSIRASSPKSRTMWKQLSSGRDLQDEEGEEA